MIKKRHFSLLALSLMLTVSVMHSPDVIADAALVEQATRAAEQGDVEGVVIANERLSLIYSEEPAWISDAVEAASVLDEDGEEAIMILEELITEANEAALAGDLEAVLEAKQTAQEVAMDFLGPEHIVTINVTVDLASFYLENGMGDPAHHHR